MSLPDYIVEEKYKFDDYHTVNIIPYIHESFKLIEKSLSRNESVLIHCKEGISRSATLIMGYLILKYKLKRAEALEMLESKRNCVHPNHGFYKQLGLIENEL